VKGFTSGVAACQASAMIFVVVKVFPFMLESLGAAGSYYAFAAMCGVTVVFSFFFVPDTRNMSAAQLQEPIL
jgi:hypothetical protein